MRAGTKVGAFLAGLVVVGAAGAGVGAVAGPVDTGSSDPGAATDHEAAAGHDAGGEGDGGHADHGADTEEAAGDEHAAAEGYRLELEPLNDDLALTVVGPDGHAVIDVEERHTEPLHLIVVGRDLVTYAHLHPTVTADGTWSTPAPDLPPGSYQVVADVVPVDGPELALLADLTVPGAAAEVAVPAPSVTAEVDGLSATIEGEPVVGDSELSFTITRGDDVVTPEPYLGARGHLVAFRTTDLAYSHVHPHDGDGTPVVFTASFPSGGAHRLFLDVQVDGVVRTFAFTVEVADHEHH